MKKQKIEILVGLPGSGKSTYAKDVINKYPAQWVRINKDDIRSMMFNNKWTKHKEKLVIQVEEDIIISALHDGYNVILDNTHLGGKHIERVKKLLFEYDFDEVEVIINDSFLDIKPEVCIQRDLKRVNSVGQNVIWDMYWRHVAKIETPEIVTNVQSAIIVDLDGTLAQMKGRHPFEWDKVDTDLPRQHIIDMVNTFADAGYTILIVTGRDGSALEKSKKWLANNQVSYNHIISRAAGDMRKDFVVKKEIFKTMIEPFYSVQFVLDDRPQVIREWRRLGLPVLNANPLDKEF